VWTKLASHMDRIADEIESMNEIARSASLKPNVPPRHSEIADIQVTWPTSSDLRNAHDQFLTSQPVTTGFENTEGLYEVNGKLKLPTGARRLLSAVLTWYGKGLSEGTWRAAATLKKSGTYDTYKSILVTNGLVEVRSDGLVYATEAGLKYAGNDLPPTPTTTAEVLALWEKKLTPGARRMLQALIRVGRPMSKEELGAEAEISHTGGSFDTYLSSLKTAQLIVKNGKTFVANREVLFL